jgi:hypothetical protein
VAALTSSCACAGPAWGPHPICPDLALEPSSRGGQRIPRYFFIDVDGLGMLSEIVESRKASRAVALEGTLSGVLANVASQMFAAGETQVAGRKCVAEEPLTLLLFGRRGVTPWILIVVGIILVALGVVHRFV